MKAQNYSGIKIDGTLTFKNHIEAMENKLKSRNNIVTKLAWVTIRDVVNEVKVSFELP